MRKVLGIALTRVQQWNQTKEVIRKIEHNEIKMDILNIFLTQISNGNNLDLQWKYMIEIAFNEKDEESRIALLKEIASTLSKISKHEYLLRLVQHTWSRLDNREPALALLSMAYQLLPFNPQIGTDFCKAFTWVNTIIGE